MESVCVCDVVSDRVAIAQLIGNPTLRCCCCCLRLRDSASCLVGLPASVLVSRWTPELIEVQLYTRALNVLAT